MCYIKVNEILKMKGMFIRMKKSSKVSKNNIRINGNFFIFQGIVISILLYLSWGSWIKFIIYVALEAAAYYAFVYFLLVNSIKKKRNKKIVYSNNSYKKVVNDSVEVIEFGETKRLRKVGKNYNWEVSDRSNEQEYMEYSNNNQNVHYRRTETSNLNNAENRVTNNTSTMNNAKRNVSREEVKKFVPYRSPFDPIRPKEEEQKIETENASEIVEANLPDSGNVKVDISEPVQLKQEEGPESNTKVNDLEENYIEENYLKENNVEKIDDTENDEKENIATENDVVNDVEEDNTKENGIDVDNTKDDMEDYEQYCVEGIMEACVEESVYEGIEEGIEEDVEEVETCLQQILHDDKEEFEERKQITLKRGFKKAYKKVPIDPKPAVRVVQQNVPQCIQSGRKVLNMAEYEPPIELLKKNEVPNYDQETEAHIEYTSHKLIDTLASFGVGAKVINVSKGPTVTRYELQPNAGVKVSKIINLADDIALNLAATGVRIEAPIPGKAAVGIEIPNKKNIPVLLRDVIETEAFKNYDSKLAFAVGKDIAGNVVVGDIAKMPHLLIAGATGSGKSVCINTLIISILYKSSPADVRLLMVDPKVVELGIYNGIPHLLIPVVTEPKKAAGALTWAVNEMTNRYRLFADNNVRDLRGYNELIKERGEGETLPQIVIIIDELADLMMVAPNEVEDSICRLAQMARAAGMHLVIATQRPSVNVITGVIKANIPSRISFAVSSQIDSRTILDMAGAEKLLGRGDMLFYPLGQRKPLRVQGSFISDKEVERVVEHIKSLQRAEYDEEILQKIESQTAETPKPDASGDDELLPQAIMMVLELGQASASLIQRKFKVGYSRAARILDQMEAWGVVSASDGSGKPRQILISKQDWIELNA